MPKNIQNPPEDPTEPAGAAAPKVRRIVVNDDFTELNFSGTQGPAEPDVYECPGNCDTLVLKQPGGKGLTSPAKLVIKL